MPSQLTARCTMVFGCCCSCTLYEAPWPLLQSGCKEFASADVVTVFMAAAVGTLVGARSGAPVQPPSHCTKRLGCCCGCILYEALWQWMQLCRLVLESAGRGQVQQAAAPRHFAWCWPRRALPAVYLSQEALRLLLLIDARHLSEGGECVGNMAPFGSGEGCFPAVSPRAPAVFGMLGAEGVVIERVEEKMLRR